jgi:hypothetical protein
MFPRRRERDETRVFKKMGDALGFSAGGTHPGSKLKPSTAKMVPNNEDVSDAEIKDKY